MIVIEAGHIYDVENVDGDGTQRLYFVRRRGRDAELLPLEKRQEGILSQELLRVLIDRTMYLHNEQPWQENVKIIHHLRDSLRLYESRAARRNIEKLSMPELRKTCPRCDHMLCFCDLSGV